jgi:hypothetical protein
VPQDSSCEIDYEIDLIDRSSAQQPDKRFDRPIRYGFARARPNEMLRAKVELVGDGLQTR